jgi:hypothetical protein
MAGALVLTSSLFLACSSTDVQHGQGGGPGTGGVGNGGNGGAGNGGNGGNSGGGGNGGSTGGGGTGGSGGNCGVLNFMLTKSGTPDLLIVQDISGSMGDTENDTPPTGTQQSKWQQIRAGLETVVSQVTTVNWGLYMFPAQGFSLQCVNAQPDVPVAPNNAAAITAKLNATTPGNGTPTTDALKTAVTYLQGLKDGNGKFIVLATDGEPNDCSSGNDDSAGAIAEVMAAANAGINTFVVGIGTTTGAVSTLNSMATAGKEPQAGTPSYYPVTSQAALEKSLSSIATGLVSCTYQLQMPPANPDLVEIDGNGVKIPRDPTHMNGWDFGPGNMSIIFYGQACDNLQKGVTTSISAVYGCPPIS